MSTKIEWADETWNPITGCSPVSAGCNNCYAKRMANRLRGRHGYPADNPFNVTLHPDRLEQPFRWSKPRKVFVCSMGDLFHDDVPFEFIAKVFGVMHDAKQHIFMVLTKRPERMKEFFEWFTGSEWRGAWPKEYPHVMIGVTAENQETANRRIPILLSIPATMRFVSVEPMLGAISFRWAKWESWKKLANNHLDGLRRLNWVIVGGESGPGARPMQPEWVRRLRDECREAGVPFLFKQWGEWAPMQLRDAPNGTVKVFRELKKLTSLSEPCLAKIGKKAAGRLLDGREWNEYPMAEEVKS